MRRFNLAIVGCGGVSRMHLDGYQAHPERVRVVAACDPEVDRARQVAEEYAIPAVFPSIEEMIAGADWEIAVVCTPTSVREPVVGTLVAAGKPLFIEKPLAASYAEAERMVAACADAGVQIAVNQNFRYHYPFEIAREIIQNGRIGKVLGVLHQDLMFRQDKGWRLEQSRHALSVMGIHWLDGFRFMLGREAQSLVCQMHSSPAIECEGETDAFLQVVFAGGASVSYVQSFSSPIGRTETLVFGEKELLLLRYEDATLYDRENRRDPLARLRNPYSGAGKPESAFKGLDSLLAAMEEGREPPNSGRDNLKTVALLEAAYRSAEAQRPILFEEGKPL